MQADEIAVALLAVNMGRCRPPLDEDEVWAIARSVGRYTPVPDAPDLVVAVEGKPPRNFHQQDAGNGELFAYLHGDQVRYDHRRGRFLLWQNHWWQPDQDAAVLRRAKQTTRTRLRWAADVEDQDQREKEVRWALGSESHSRLTAMLAQARSEHPITDPGTDWDSRTDLLGVANGVVELRTGELRPGAQADRITMHTEVPYDATAECPRWLRFLGEVFLGDQELIDYVHRGIGYSVSGATREQCLFICYGGGSNGKTTFLGIVRHVLGDYGHNMPFSALELSGRAAIPNDVADLVGRRLVTASETNESARLNEARVKALVGEDPITARHLHQEFFTFRPVAKFWLGVNHRPRVSDDSHGFWRRVRLIPFVRQFEGASVDKRLADKLLAESAGILAWAVRGCLEWQRRGLEPPAVVINATAEYQRDSDPLGGFLEEACVVGAAESSLSSELYKAYHAWAEHQGLPEREQLKHAAFGRRVGDRFKKQRTERGAVYFGVRPSTPADGFGAPSQSQADGSDPHFDISPSSFLVKEKNPELPSNPSSRQPACRWCGFDAPHHDTNPTICGNGFEPRVVAA
jgi:putative DNA primase/helicase